MFEYGGGAGAKLSWQSLSQTREVVPTAQLFPTSSAVTLRTADGVGHRR